MLKATIAVFATMPDLQPQALALANHLNLPYLASQDPLPFEKGGQGEFYDYLLILTPHYLGLQKTNTKTNPLYIDFLSGKMQYRRQHASLRKEIIARALGLKTKAPKKIVDTTAGLARDSFILATLGFEVQLLERSPIIFSLLENAIQRASADATVGPIIQRLHPIQADAATWLKNLKSSDHPQIIYLDPMFPERQNSALSKQDMRIFHEIVGDDLDADALLETALTCATERVVVKRPRLALPLANRKPALSMEGSSNRFDIYLIRD